MTVLCTAPDCERPGDAYLCNQHTDRLRLVLAELPALLEEVRLTVERQDHIAPSASPSRKRVDEDSGDWRDWAHVKDEPHFGTKLAPLPINVRAAGFYIEAQNELLALTWDLAETRGWPRDAALRPQTAGPTCGVTWSGRADGKLCGHDSCRAIHRDRAKQDLTLVLCAWLMHAVPSIRLDEHGGDILVLVQRLRARCRAVVDARDVRIYAGPCGSETSPLDAAGEACCTLDLYHSLTDDQITCDGWGTTEGVGCGATHTLGSKRVFLRAQVGTATATWDELWRAIPDLFPGPMPGAGQMRVWKHRSLIADTRADLRAVRDDGGDLVYRRGQGVPLYRGADVLAALNQWRTLGAKASRGRRHTDGARCA